MIYSVNFVDMASKINPHAVIRYLKETGWNQFTTKRTKIKVFQYETENVFEQVTVPIDIGLSDYNNAMHSVIKKIANIENKSLEQVMLYLLNPQTDIIKIRLDKKGVETGNILFDDAIKLYENAKKLLQATALDVVNHKKVHSGRPDDAVQRFLSECRFGQTEIGSYVVSLVCPFAELSEEDGYKQLSIFSDEERCAGSLTRKVTNKLMENIYIIKNKINDGETNKLVQISEEMKISVNFYEALNGLSEDMDDSIFEFNVQWSPTVKSNRFRHSKIDISSFYHQPIASVIESLRKQPKKYTEIVGRIKKLDASPIADLRTIGMVTILYIGEDEKSKTVTVKLEKNDYDRAVEAHLHGKFVKVVGELKNSKGKASVMECSMFDVC